MMNPTIFRDPEGTKEMRRLIDIVESGLGQEPYEVTGIKAGPWRDFVEVEADEGDDPSNQTANSPRTQAPRNGLLNIHSV